MASTTITVGSLDSRQGVEERGAESSAATPPAAPCGEGAGGVDADALVAEEGVAETEDRVHIARTGAQPGVDDGRLSPRPHDVHRAGEARVEGVDDAQRLDRLLRRR